MAYSWVKEIGYPTDLPFKEVLQDTETGINQDSISGLAVPPDEVWEVNQIFFYGAVAATLNLRLFDPETGVSGNVEQKEFTKWISWSGKIFLTEGQKIVGATTSTANLVLKIYGVKRLSLESALASQKLRIDLILPTEVDVQEPLAVKDPLM
ncbi:unnamed protein product [marine sediment metagenome]|uniref:Uncharacterized protein n=1 Tax=marine sediment metagenome TaxID=412755 RepID=X1KLP5_9ZZZZ